MYGKHFSSMYSGSMRGSGPLAFAVWGWVISHQMPNHGRTEFTVEIDPGLVAFQIGKVTEEEVRKQVKEFCGPDQKSRTEAEEGRKLVEINAYCYRVVNGAYYDQMRKSETRREYDRVRKAEQRAAKKAQENGESESDPAPIRKGSQSAVEELLNLAGAVYQRAEGQQANYMEESAAAEIVRRDGWKEEAQVIFAFKAKLEKKGEGKYFPNSLGSLLQGWPATLDRARNHKSRSKASPI